MRPQRTTLAAILVLALASLAGCHTQPARARAAITPLAGSITPLVSAFNAAAAHARVLLIVSPT